MQKYIATAIKKDVNNPTPEGETPAVGIAVYVYLKSTGAQAVIYSDNGVNQETQPLLTDGNGRVEFYAANGRYNIQYDLPSGFQTDEDIILYDESDDIATTEEAIARTNDSKKMTPKKVFDSYSQFGIGKSGATGDLDFDIVSRVNSGIYAINATCTITAPQGQSISDAYLITSTRVSSGSLAQQMQIYSPRAFPKLFLRTATNNVFTPWVEFFSNDNLIFAQNSSGSTILSNTNVSGSSLTPPNTGTFKNVQTTEVPNNSYGIFLRV